MKPYYEHAGITIYHGDCREVLPELEPVDLVLTDPPFGIGFAARPTKWQRRHGMRPQAWDNEPIPDSVLDLIRNCAEHCIIWGGHYYQLPRSRGWLCWYKPDSPPSMGDFELAWTNFDQNPRIFIHSISATNGDRVDHPTQKPLPLMKWAIQQCPYWDTALDVLDPFMGSGTTLRAAKDLNRLAIGIEIEEKYCEIAAKRLSQDVLDFAPAAATPLPETPELF